MSDAFRQDFERILLFTAGGMAVFAWSLMVYRSPMRDVTHLWGYNSLSGFFARPDLELYRRLCVLLVVLVFRPEWPGRYYQVVVAVFVATSLLMVPVEGILHPGSRTAPEQSGTSPFTPSHRSGAPAGSTEKWAQIVRDFPAAFNKKRNDFHDDIRASGLPEQLRISDMLADPDKYTDRLKRAHRVVRQYRAAYAKLVADTNVALEAEQHTAKSPLLQSYEERYTKQGATIDRDLALYDQIVMVFDAMLNDLTHPKGQVEVRGDKIHFSNPEDHDAYQRHIDRLHKVEQEQQDFRKELASKPE